jgi:hypothetical protein
MVQNPWTGEILKPRLITHVLGLALCLGIGVLFWFAESHLLKWLGFGKWLRAILIFLAVVPFYFGWVALWNRYVVKWLTTRIGVWLLFKPAQPSAGTRRRN